MIKITRIVLHPSYVRSNYDGDLHFVTAGQLRGLYNLKDGDIEIIVKRESRGMRLSDEDLHLSTRSDGEYFDAPKFIREHNERITP